MRYVFFACVGILVALAGIYRLNQYMYSAFFKGLLPGGSSVRFIPDQENYAKNYHVSYDVEVQDGNYEFLFKFRDNNQVDRTWRWSYPEDVTDEMIGTFGVPNLVFEPYYPSDTAIRRRMNMIDEGLFVLEDGAIGPDLNKMINYYRPFLEPLSTLLDNSLGEDISYRSRVELLMKFVQDIPYCTPPAEQHNKYTGGVFPPPQVFINMYGDCDSKVVIFSGTLSYFSGYDMLILQETGHVLTALKGIPKPYDKFYEYRNNQYIMAETAGPDRSNLGVITDPYKNIKVAIPVKIE